MLVSAIVLYLMVVLSSFYREITVLSLLIAYRLGNLIMLVSAIVLYMMVVLY